LSDITKNLTEYLANDLIRFSVSFPVIITAVLIIVPVIAFMLRNKGDKEYEDILLSDSQKHLKKIMKNLKEESFIESVEIDMSSMIGMDEYLPEGIDYLFNSVVGQGDEILSHEEEKKLRKHLENSNDIFTRGYKRNVVNIFLSLKENDEVKISFFHLYFFAKYFPHYLDVNMDGNFILAVDSFTVEMMVERLENKEDKFDFKTFFYFVINHIDSHKLEMSTYTKIKELFSQQIFEQEKNSKMKKKVSPKLVMRKNSESREKKIFKRIIQKKPSENQIQSDRLIEEKKSTILDENVHEENAAEAPVVKKEPIKRNKDEVFVDENGNYTTIAKKDIKKKTAIAKKDIKEQIQVSSKLEVLEIEDDKKILESSGEQSDGVSDATLEHVGNLFVPDDIVLENSRQSKAQIDTPIQEQKLNKKNRKKVKPKIVSLETPDVSLEVHKNKKLSAEKRIFKKTRAIEAQKAKESFTQPEAVDSHETKTLQIENTEEHNELNFEIAKKIKKKKFIPLVNFIGVVRSMLKNDILNDISLLFVYKDEVYISGEFLFISILNGYELEDENFSENFLRKLMANLKPFTKEDAKIESRDLFVEKLDKKVVSTFLIISSSVIGGRLGDKFMNNIRQRQSIKKYNHDEIDLINFIKERNLSEQ